MLRVILSEAFKMVLELDLFKFAVGIAVIVGLIWFILVLCSEPENSFIAHFFFSLLVGGVITLLITIAAFIILYLILVIGSLILGILGLGVGIMLL